MLRRPTAEREGPRAACRRLVARLRHHDPLARDRHDFSETARPDRGCRIDFPLDRGEAAMGSAIRPFRIEIPEADLTDLRRRIQATKWPERELVPDQTQGVQLATMQALARYWGTEYDWRRCEAKLNELPHFITEIDGLDIHF